MIDQVNKSSGLASASRFCGFLFFIPVIGLLAGIAAVVMGGLALYRIHRDNNNLEGKPLASTGIVLGALGILLTLVVYRPLLPGVISGLRGGPGQGQLIGSSSDTNKGQRLPSLGMTSLSFSKKQRAQKSLLRQPWGRDPFALRGITERPRLIEGPVAALNYELTGVLIRSGKKVAIINRFFVREGDEIEGAHVVLIEDDRVKLHLKDKDKDVTLRMRSL